MMTLIVCTLYAFANGGPVELSEATPSGNVVPKETQDIQLISENLGIRVLNTQHYAVNALYTLKNKKKQNVKYGIPVQWLLEFDFKEFVQRKLTLKMNGTSYKCEEIIETDTVSDDFQSGWCIISMTIPKGNNIPLELEYRGELLRMDWATNKSMLVSYSSRLLNYDFSPAGYWKGNIKKIDITLDLGELAPYAKIDFLPPKKVNGTVYSWSFTDIDLKNIKPMSVEFTADQLLAQNDAIAELKAKPITKYTSLKASSTLANQGSQNYNVTNLQDLDFSTAWCEGAEGSGIGESIELRISPDAKVGSSLWMLAISAGYAKNEKVWNNNGRVQSMNIRLCEEEKYQTFQLNTSNWHHSLHVFEVEQYHDETMLFEKVERRLREGKEVCLKFTIDSLIESKYKDTCISEMHLIYGMQ